jgi:transcription antitermination factor NusA-like protein
LVFQAIGKGGENVKYISNTLRKKIKVISMPSKEAFDSETSDTKKIAELREFIKEIVAPVEITSVDFKEGVLTISGSRESKAILIGRDRSREKELAEVLERTFGVKEFKIL